MPYDQKKTGVITAEGGRFGVDVAEPPPCCLCVDGVALPKSGVLHPQPALPCPDCISTADSDYYDDDRILTSETNSVITTFSHNNRGDLASKTVPGTGTTEYTFNAAGELRKIEYPDDSSSVYDYDPGSIRRRKTEKNTAGDIIAETRYFYADLNGLPRIISEEKLFGSDPRLTHYAYAAGLLLRDIDGIITYFLVGDNLNVIGLADESGAITDRYDYTPYGSLISHTGADANRIMFCSEPNDEESGFVYLRMRYYHPKKGRLHSRDAKSGIGRNNYYYCMNDPVNLYDPTGLQAATATLPWWITAVSGIGGGGSAATGAGIGASGLAIPAAAVVVTVGGTAYMLTPHYAETIKIAREQWKVEIRRYYYLKRVKRLKADPKAKGRPHTRFSLRDPKKDYDPKKNPIDKYTEFDKTGREVKRFRRVGRQHNKVDPPLTYDPKNPGDLPKRGRKPDPWEIPGEYGPQQLKILLWWLQYETQ